MKRKLFTMYYVTEFIFISFYLRSATEFDHCAKRMHQSETVFKSLAACVGTHATVSD